MSDFEREVKSMIDYIFILVNNKSAVFSGDLNHHILDLNDALLKNLLTAE